MSSSLPTLRVGVIGAGRVGAVLGAALRLRGHDVVSAAGESDASLRRVRMLLPGVPVLKPKPLPYDPLDWVQRPLHERGRMVCEAWAMQGYGTPPGVFLFYALKMALYVGGWLAACATSPSLSIAINPEMNSRSPTFCACGWPRQSRTTGA